MSEAATLDLFARDASGASRVKASGVDSGSTVGQFVRTMLAQMGLVEKDPAGRPLLYRARNERTGEVLNGSQKLGDVVEAGDEVVVAPRINAGGASQVRQ